MNDTFEKIKAAQIPDALKSIMDAIAPVAKSLGRFVAKQLLCLYYVLKEGDLSDSEKITVYGALIYVIAPKDLIPRKVFGVLGITDDVLAIGLVINMVKDKITPEITAKVDAKLDEWFEGSRVEPLKIDEQ